MLHISVDVVVVVVEHTILFGMAMDEVHRCGALVPWLSSEEDAAARSEGGEFKRMPLHGAKAANFVPISLRMAW